VAGEIDKPTETLRRVMHGVLVDGKHDMLSDVVLPYTCIIELYQRATQPTPALAGEKACACGCGALVRVKKKWATPLGAEEGRGKSRQPGPMGGPLRQDLTGYF
jgi:hypothetical protein